MHNISRDPAPFLVWRRTKKSFAQYYGIYSQLLEPTTPGGMQKINLPSFLLALAANQPEILSRFRWKRNESTAFNPLDFPPKHVPKCISGHSPFAALKRQSPAGKGGDLLLLQIASFTKGDMLRISPPFVGVPSTKGGRGFGRSSFW